MKKVEYYCDSCNAKLEKNKNLTYVTFSKYLSGITLAEEDKDFLQIEVCKDCLADIKEYINKGEDINE